MIKFIILGEAAADIAMTIASDDNSWMFGELLHRDITFREQEALRKTIGGKPCNNIPTSGIPFLYPGANPELFLHNFFNMPTSHDTASLGAILYEQQLVAFPGVVAYLESNPDVKVLISIHDNPLQYLANKKMNMRRSEKVYLSPAICRDWLERYDKIGRILPNKESLSVDPISFDIAKVNAFLGSKPKKIYRGHRDEQAEIINHSQLRQRFAGTDLERYF